MHRHLHVGIAYHTLTADPRQLEPLIGELAGDWVRYATNCWILWTDKSTLTCGEMIRSKIHPHDTVLVARLGGGQDVADLPAGRLPTWVWEWINRPRDAATGAVHLPTPPPILSPPAAVDGNIFLNALKGLSLPGPGAPPPPKK